MKLHFRGLEVPALGSPRDKVYREYLFYEAKLESKKHQLNLLTTLASPVFSGDEQRRAWDKQAKLVFDQYVALLFGAEEIPENKEEVLMKRYYEEVVKKSRPVLKRVGKGKLVVSNLPKV